jgi:hypothetical protein
LRRTRSPAAAWLAPVMQQVWAAELGLRRIGDMGQMELRIGDGSGEFSAGCVAGGWLEVDSVHIVCGS